MDFRKLGLVCFVLLAAAAFVHALGISNVQATNVTSSGAIITWNTDVASDSQMYYWTAGYEFFGSKYDNTSVAFHAFYLSNLSANTTYAYNVQSCTANFTNCTGSGNYSFTTLANATLTPSPTPGPTPSPTPVPSPTPTPVPAPVIYNVSANSVTNQSAAINWLTDITSDSKVYYGTTANYTDFAYLADLVTGHLVNLYNLIAGTLYHYSVESCNNGSCTQSADYNFTTLANATPTPSPTPSPTPEPTPSPTPSPTPTITPTPTPVPCTPAGGYCTANAQCCSKKCNIGKKKCR